MVGREIGFLLSQLEEANLLDDFSTVMISGHSLGAQVAGYAGKWTKKITGKIIGRISGTDYKNIFSMNEFRDQKLHIFNPQAVEVSPFRQPGG